MVSRSTSIQSFSSSLLHWALLSSHAHIYIFTIFFHPFKLDYIFTTSASEKLMHINCRTFVQSFDLEKRGELKHGLMKIDAKGKLFFLWVCETVPDMIWQLKCCKVGKGKQAENMQNEVSWFQSHEIMWCKKSNRARLSEFTWFVGRVFLC